MIPIYQTNRAEDRATIEALWNGLRLDPRQLALGQGNIGQAAADVGKILADVAQRGDEALVESCRKFDDPGFSAGQIRVEPQEMRQAHARIPSGQRDAIRRSIAQVREYQTHILPAQPAPLRRPGVELGLRFLPLDSAGLYFPGGKAAYPSSLIMLAVPAQVAGVKRIVACSPPSRYGRSDLVLAVCHELGLTDVFRAGGAAAIAAMAFGTATIPAVDKIVGPGNLYVQLAKRLLAGCVGIDAFLGPSEIVVIADETADDRFIAADLIAQSEHDPGRCFLVTPSIDLARRVQQRIVEQASKLDRRSAIERAMSQYSAAIVTATIAEAIEWANRLAAEHVNIQTRDDDAVLRQLRHAGAVFVGKWSPVAAGDYVAGPSHCLPTNTTARFSSGISAYEFLKRTGVARYERAGLAADADAIIAMAEAEHLSGHAASVRARLASEPPT
jgi:histidinol dehydrogenase